MKLRVDHITEQGETISLEERSEVFPALAAAEQAGECRFTAPVRAELTVAREYDHIRVAGRVKTAVCLECSRCLGEFEQRLDSAFTIFYTKAAGVAQDEEVELAEEDLISVPYAGDELDFAPELEEQVLMELPLKPLCTDECKGLCPVCGANLNAVECGCDRTPTNFKLSALKNFKSDK